MARARIGFQDSLDRSIWFNDLLIPATAAESALAGHVECLFVWNDDAVYRVSLVGSGVAVRYRGRYLVLCTRHQLKGLNDLERVSLLTKAGVYCVSSSGVRYFQDVNEIEYHDLACFDFTDPCGEMPDLRDRFFEFRDLPPDAPSSDIVFLIAAGFPFDDQKYDLGESNQLGLAKRIIICALDGKSNDPSLLRLRPLHPLNFNPNGMSGGSVFVVQRGAGNSFRAHLAGMIVRAGTDFLHIVKVGFLVRFLDQFIKT